MYKQERGKDLKSTPDHLYQEVNKRLQIKPRESGRWGQGIEMKAEHTEIENKHTIKKIIKATK